MQMLAVLILISTALQTFAFPRFSDFNIDVGSIQETDNLNTRDALNLILAGSSFLSDTPTPTDEFTLGSTSATLNQSPGSAVQLKSASKSDQIADNSLHLRSSDRSIVAVNGDTLYASPMNSTELLALLLSTHDDLSAKSKENGQTNFYQFNHTTWSFQVAVAEGTLNYTSISAIVTRFLRLIPSEHLDPIIWSRVGCVYQGGKPIADVAILPLVSDQQTTFTDFSTIDNARIPLTPVKVMTISPNGVTNSTEVISPHALDIYNSSLVTTLPKRQASPIGREMIMKVFDSGVFLTMEILRDPDGLVARAMISLLIIPFAQAYCKLAMGLIAGLVFEPWVGDLLGELYQLDSGSYRLGQLSGEFIIKATARDEEGNLIAFKAETLKAVVNALLGPLIQTEDKKEPIYAMGGEILGPDPVNRTEGVVPLGTWELRVEPTPAIVHDEL
ncbi:MAG: hypothetical protein Q9225_006672 [Loekoesia sp. 1 TL-2023]